MNSQELLQVFGNYKNLKTVVDYSDSIISGQKIANRETMLMVERFYRDLENDNYVFNPKPAEFIIHVIESQITHDKGETFSGEPLRGKPFLLEPWQKFIIYNIMSFYHKNNPTARRYKEAFIFVPRKNGKTRFAAAFAWALSILYSKSKAETYIVASSLKQSRETFDYIEYNVKNLGLSDTFRILNNNQESSISKDFGPGKGAMKIQALASNPEKQDGLLFNIGIADEMHSYKSENQYNVIKDGMKGYANKTMIGITTAGSNPNTFCYRRLQYCTKILEQVVENESYFVFIAKADPDENGYVDMLDPIQHEKANPNYGIALNPRDLMDDAGIAFHDPGNRKNFYAKHLNIYTSSSKSYFDIEEFRSSNKQVEEKLDFVGLTLEDKLDKLSKLPITWYGGVDLALLHDLTAATLYGRYGDIEIVIPHAFFPLQQAHNKSEDDNIPVFGWQDDGWLTLTAGNVTDHEEVVKWMVDMKKRGFNIAKVGYDVRFADEFVASMENNGFRNKIDNTPQYAHKKAEGFRRIEAKVKAKNFYYLSSDAYEYCALNVQAVERTDVLHYQKVQEQSRIDLFDASVFACLQMMEGYAKGERNKAYLNKLGNKHSKKGG